MLPFAKFNSMKKIRKSYQLYLKKTGMYKKGLKSRQHILIVFFFPPQPIQIPISHLWLWFPEFEKPIFTVCGDQILVWVVGNTNDILLMNGQGSL